MSATYVSQIKGIYIDVNIIRTGCYVHWLFATDVRLNHKYVTMFSMELARYFAHLFEILFNLSRNKVVDSFGEIKWSGIRKHWSLTLIVGLKYCCVFCNCSSATSTAFGCNFKQPSFYYPVYNSRLKPRDRAKTFSNYVCGGLYHEKWKTW